MVQVGDIFEYISDPWYVGYSKHNISTYIVIDAQNAPVYKLMCMFDNTEIYEDEDRLTNVHLYRILA